MGTSSLVTNRKGSLHGGVNQQAPEYRLGNQVEEMVNCLPTINEGLRLRNPTAQINLKYPNGDPARIMTGEQFSEAFVYEHDKGNTGAAGESKLVFMITELYGFEIIDLSIKSGASVIDEALTGILYTAGHGLVYQDNADTYINGKFNGRSGYAMTTVKDTTFIVNKTVSPVMITSFDDPDTENPLVDYGDVHLTPTSVAGLNPETVAGSGTSYTFTSPEDMVIMNRMVVGGGGGGAGGRGGRSNDDGSADYSFGGGGYAADVKFDELLDDGIDATYAIVIGTGGGGGAHGNGQNACSGSDNGTNGGAGTATSVGTLSSPAGGGGSINVMASNGYIPEGEGNTNGIGGNNGDGTDGHGAAGTNKGTGGGGGGIGDSGTCFPWPNDSEDGGNGGAGATGEVSLSWQTLNTDASSYMRNGYIWVKSTDVVTGYKYGVTLRIQLKDGTQLPAMYIGLSTESIMDTNAAAEDLASRVTTALATANAGAAVAGSATSNGSMVQISLTEDDIIGVDAIDSFGDLASFGWAHSVDSMQDLPINMGGFVPVVEVGIPQSPTYWVRYNEGRWLEYRQPDTYSMINEDTMPHIATRVYNDALGYDEYIVSAYDWNARYIGDDDTNSVPSFIGEAQDFITIKDIFFFRNRLGFITRSSIILSEIGEYGNFFRTSVAALLDSDRIDAGVESVNAVNLEYSVALENSMILFADKAQFRFNGGDFLSPSNFTIVQEMAYDVNIKVRPLFMNDRIFFIAPRGIHSAVYEMQVSNQSTLTSQANDITAHCQTYIDGAVDKLSGSPVDNMLFVTSQNNNALAGARIFRNTVFVYKYLDAGGVRQQSAWFKWTYDGDVLSGFALSNHFYLLIDRTDILKNSPRWIMNGIDDPDIVTAGKWNMSEQWNMKGIWMMSYETYEHAVVFERMQIHPRAINLSFLDNGATQIDGLVEFGEWVYGVDGNRDPRGSLQLKTAEIFADGYLKLWVIDKQRQNYREVSSKYALSPRKPMVYGRSKNVRIGIKNEGDTGFRIDSVSLEGIISRRATSR